MFVIVVIQNLEGERDYGQQTLATCAFLRSQFCHGVVHMVLVRVKVPGVKRRFLATLRKVVYTITRS